MNRQLSQALCCVPSNKVAQESGQKLKLLLNCVKLLVLCWWSLLGLNLKRVSNIQPEWTKKQLISWQAAYGLEQDLMSPESYLEYETPNKKYVVIREPIAAVFHVLLLLLLLFLLPQCLEATSGCFHKRVLFPGVAPREAVSQGQNWWKSCM